MSFYNFSLAECRRQWEPGKLLRQNRLGQFPLRHFRSPLFVDFLTYCVLSVGVQLRALSRYYSKEIQNTKHFLLPSGTQPTTVSLWVARLCLCTTTASNHKSLFVSTINYKYIVYYVLNIVIDMTNRISTFFVNNTNILGETLYLWWYLLHKVVLKS